MECEKMKRMYVEAKELDKWDRWLKEPEVDFDKVDFPYDATLFCQTVAFGDGTQADLKVCSGQTNLWCEMVWFDEGGYEIACSDACSDELEGVWKFDGDGGEEYDVEVVRVETQPAFVVDLLDNARENEKVLRRMRNYLVLMPNYEAVKDAVLEAIVSGLEEHADATLRLINRHDVKQEDNKDEQD